MVCETLLWILAYFSCVPFKRFESPEFENNSKVDAYPTLAKTRIECNAFTKLHELRKDNPFRIMICQIDINPKRNKFDTFKGLIYNIVDSFLISEIKIDDPWQRSYNANNSNISNYLNIIGMTT